MSRTGADDGDGENGIFSAIGPEQCAELLTEHSIGRVARQSAEGQQILAATYVWFEGTVVFRTSPYGWMSKLIRPTDVAFRGRRRGPRSAPRLECRCPLGVGHPQPVHPDQTRSARWAPG